MTPTARTLQHLSKANIPVDIVERYLPQARRRKDLFGFADLVALDEGIVALQVTSGSHHAQRRQKILDSDLARDWLRNGGRIQVWSWRKSKRVGWNPRIEEITLEDFPCA